MNIDFSRNLIKGRIAEVIFEQMIREEEQYTVIPFGYEHTMPTLAQYRHISEVPKVIDNISEAPDFALVSEDKTKIYLVEVKYQKNFNLEEIKNYSEKLLKRWESPWIFIATQDNFYCAPCSSVMKNGDMSKLSESWVKKERQLEYLKLLNEFENKLK
ncbi:TPA: hypothetical protein DCZ46_03110 [Candidatus Campbellbacteria bacterium]|nr:MAG: seg [Candidatus Campbellbacteria bacterium GW2011_OD1_34_28]KKP74880.1 MAG: hypothetical protein UR74_C0002G0146 [Candidatus Campbellbacteria bacterium GW2011_GWD2_35_24]KKP75766.1 MAG: hypothetical protein UR75_C0002G0147 [Candidatus Campbellbacteria bacterium GW2011_GWC2_35_28]KKP76986.1 MAG: hypothetical protein UR76_C0002G0187 [Candidatus Campbellbacteria bacterium GW2011_GWC1_35_31]KKP78912.1 MAG: hypothetical protein UR79_C0002G0187 [Candidatus Campbellbacteria bacterium GW2011_GW